jgi:hypothetical protein
MSCPDSLSCSQNKFVMRFDERGEISPSIFEM